MLRDYRAPAYWREWEGLARANWEPDAYAAVGDQAAARRLVALLYWVVTRNAGDWPAVGQKSDVLP